MKKTIKRILGLFGFSISRFVEQRKEISTKLISSDSMAEGLKRAKNKFNISPETIIDLGAAAGTWTVKAEKVWADKNYLLFEPLKERKKELDKLQKRNPKLIPVFAAAGNFVGKVRFLVTSDLDGSGVSDTHTEGNFREVELTTIDAQVKKNNAKHPYLLKFDTHGFEIPILQGAADTLKKTEMIVMECYGFRIANNSLLFHEMCAHLEKEGFRLADVVDIMRRPGDEMFWQCDAFFLRTSHPVFRYNSYAE